MKSKLIATLLLAGSSLFAAPRFAVGVGIGVGPGYGYVAAPPSPGPGYTFVDGYWVGEGPRRVWQAGYWAAPHFDRDRDFRRDFHEGSRRDFHGDRR